MDLLEVDLDPRIAGRDQREHQVAGLDVFAGLEPDRAQHAGDRRIGRGVRQVERRAVAPRLGLQIQRVTLDRRVEFAAQLGEHHAVALAQHLDLLARHFEIVQRRVELGARAGALGLELLLAFVLDDEVARALAGGGDLALALAVLRAHRRDALAYDGQLCVGRGERNLIGLGVELEQELAFLDPLVVGDQHPDDAAVDVGADVDDSGLHIGVLGGHVTPAGGVEIAGRGDRRDRHGEQEEAAQDESPEAAPLARRLARRRLGRLRRLDRRNRRVVNDGHGRPSNEIHPSSTNTAISGV